MTILNRYGQSAALVALVIALAIGWSMAALIIGAVIVAFWGFTR